MASVEGRRDHTYSAKLGNNPPGSKSATVHNIHSYLSETLDDTFTIQSVSLPSFNWLVITNAEQTVQSEISGIVHTGRILVEHNKELNTVKGSFQVLYKTHTECKLGKPSDIDQLLTDSLLN